MASCLIILGSRPLSVILKEKEQLLSSLCQLIHLHFAVCTLFSHKLLLVEPSDLVVDCLPVEAKFLSKLKSILRRRKSGHNLQSRLPTPHSNEKVKHLGVES